MWLRKGKMPNLVSAPRCRPGDCHERLMSLTKPLTNLYAEDQGSTRDGRKLCIVRVRRHSSGPLGASGGTMRQTRRGFVGGAAVLGAGAMLPWSAAMAQTHPTRQSLSTFTRDSARVASLRR